jgi:hypothetical protein
MVQDALLVQVGIPIEENLGIIDLGDVLVFLRDGPVKLRLKRPWIDNGEKIAFFNILALLKSHCRQGPAHLGMDRNRVIGLNRSNPVQENGNVLLLNDSSDDRHRSCRSTPSAPATSPSGGCGLASLSGRLLMLQPVVQGVRWSKIEVPKRPDKQQPDHKKNPSWLTHNA